MTPLSLVDECKSSLSPSRSDPDVLLVPLVDFVTELTNRGFLGAGGSGAKAPTSDAETSENRIEARFEPFKYL